MKYCPSCGAQVTDEAAFCPSCGKALKETVEATPVSSSSPSSSTKAKDNKSLILVALIFMIISCATVGWSIIPLAWMVPMTVIVYQKYKNNEEITIGFKICVLLFVSLVAGIILLVMEE